MKKAVLCLLLALVLVCAAEPHVRGHIRQAVLSLTADMADGEAQTQAPSFYEQLGSHEQTDLLAVTLYFRFADSHLLGAERVQLDIRREETIATSMVQRLIDGPSVSHSRLSGVFPRGTQVISVRGDGTTVFVTLSQEFLGRPDGAPADWEDLPQWQEEAALRRRLAAHSLALTLTEGGRYQRVQLFVAATDDDIPERVPMAYFDTSVTDPTLVLAATARDESAALTPGRAMEMIMDCWLRQDWGALYNLIAPQEDGTLPTQSVFESDMRALDISLLSYVATGGVVSFDGQTATAVLDAAIRSREGGDAQITRESVLLVREQDNWAIREDTLRSLMIRD